MACPDKVRGMEEEEDGKRETWENLSNMGKLSYQRHLEGLQVAHGVMDRKSLPFSTENIGPLPSCFYEIYFVPFVISVCDTRAEPAGNGDRPVSLVGGDGPRRHHGERGPCDILPLVGAANLQLHQKRARPSPQALGESVSLIATLIVYFAAAPFLFT